MQPQWSFSAAASTRTPRRPSLQREGFDVCALSVRTGSGTSVRSRPRAAVARALGVRQHSRWRSTSRAIRRIGPDERRRGAEGPRDRRGGASRPPTCPARNTVFLSLALAWAEVLGAQDIGIGANALDYSGYPIAGRSTSRRSNGWPRLATRAGVEGARVPHPRAAAPHEQGRDHPRGSRPGPRLRAHAQLLRSGSRRTPVRTLRQLRAPREGVCGGGGGRSTACVMHNAQCTMHRAQRSSA